MILREVPFQISTDDQNLQTRASQMLYAANDQYEKGRRAHEEA